MVDKVNSEAKVYPVSALLHSIVNSVLGVRIWNSISSNSQFYLFKFSILSLQILNSISSNSQFYLFKFSILSLQILNSISSNSISSNSQFYLFLLRFPIFDILFRERIFIFFIHWKLINLHSEISPIQGENNLKCFCQSDGV